MAALDASSPQYSRHESGTPAAGASALHTNSTGCCGAGCGPFQGPQHAVHHSGRTSLVGARMMPGCRRIASGISGSLCSASRTAIGASTARTHPCGSMIDIVPQGIRLRTAGHVHQVVGVGGTASSTVTLLEEELRHALFLPPLLRLLVGRRRLLGGRRHLQWPDPRGHPTPPRGRPTRTLDEIVSALI